MSLVSGTILSALAITLVASTVLLTKAIIDNLRDGDTDNNVSL